jgi:hypothetical protein
MEREALSRGRRAEAELEALAVENGKFANPERPIRLRSGQAFCQRPRSARFACSRQAYNMTYCLGHRARSPIRPIRGIRGIPPKFSCIYI